MDGDFEMHENERVGDEGPSEEESVCIDAMQSVSLDPQHDDPLFDNDNDNDKDDDGDEALPQPWVDVHTEYRSLIRASERLYNSVVTKQTDPKDKLDAISNMVDTLEFAWLQTPRGMSEADFLRYAKLLFGFHNRDMARVQSQEIEESFNNHHMRTFIYICSLVCAAEDEELRRHVDDQFRRVIRVITECKKNLINSSYMRQVLVSDTITMCPVDDTLNSHSFYFEHAINLEGVHKLLVFILQELERAQLRRFGDKCYKQKFIKDQVTGVVRATKYWQEECTIEQFIARKCDKEHNYEMWSIVMKGHDPTKRIRDRLMDGVEREFPELKVNRHLFSFKNGLYNCEKSTFYSYDNTELMSKEIEEEDAAMNYFDLNCYEPPDHMLQAFDIPTPTLDSIFMFQLKHTFPELLEPAKKALERAETEDERMEALALLHEAEREQQYQRNLVVWWIYVLLGRMFFELGAHDSWQICTFIKGHAGTGKSTLGKVLSYIFPHEHIGYLSSNTEEQFGLQTMYDKLLWMCLEVKENFKLPLSQLQSMISGEPVTVAIKNKDAKTVIWKSPGMMFGNEIPPWKDRAGALLRRFVMVLFQVPVTEEEKNMDMDKELFAELGTIIPKVTCIYLHACSKFKSQDIWSVLPQWFKECRENFASTVDVVCRFFQECMEVKVDEKCYAPFNLIQDEFRRWIERNIPAQKNTQFDENTYGTFFKNKGITIAKTEYMWAGELKTDRYIIGVQWTEDPHYMQKSL